MARAGWAVLAIVAGCAAAAPAHAYDWTVTLGAQGRVMPSFGGSDEYVLRPIPLIDIRRADYPRQFQSTRDGANIGIFESGAFRAGLTGKVLFPRDQDDDRDLRGLGDVGWALEVGVFGEIWPASWLRTRVEIRQGFGGHHGVVSDLSADLVMPVAPKLTLSGGPRLSLATDKALNPYFGVTPTQSPNSGLPVYDARGGIRSYGAGALARYELSPQWATHMFIEYERLAGSAAESPLVTMRGNPNQIQIGAGVTYSFNVSLF
jgi:outer membrane protein